MTRTETTTQASDDCYRCGYNLHTIANDQPCPECGLLAERSRRITDELHNTRPGWLASLARGVWLLLAAIVLAFIWMVTVPIVINRANQEYYSAWRMGMPGASRARFIVEHTVEIMLLGVGIAALMFAAGCRQLTRAEGYPPADDRDRTRRRAIRILSLPPVLGIVMQDFLSRPATLVVAGGVRTFVYSTPSLIEQVLLYAVAAILIVAAFALPLLIFYHLRSLARRARSAHLAEHCAIVGIGTTVSLAYFFGLFILQNYADSFGEHWAERSQSWLIIMLTAAVAGALFLLWSLYLLIRFAISFRNAAQALRVQWRQHDLAMAAADRTCTTQLGIVAGSSDATDACYRCGYSLHTIANDQPCPECGLLAVRSRRVTDELHNTRPRWLASIARGVLLLLAAIFVAFAWATNIERVLNRANLDYYRASAAGLKVPPKVQFMIDYSTAIVASGFHLAALMFMLGCWQLTAAEGYPPADQADRWRRKAIRVLALLPPVALGVEHYLSWRGRQVAAIMRTGQVAPPSLWEVMLAWIPYILLAIAAGTLPLLIFYHLRSLAKRARSAHLAEHCAIVGIGTTLSVVYFIGVMSFRSYGGDSDYNGMERSQAWMIVILIATVAGLLFLIWSLYLLTRFAIAFFRAARQLRAQWKQHDRAVAAGV